MRRLPAPGQIGTTPWRVVVVVPARDEAGTLADCLRALETAIGRLAVERPRDRAEVVLVLDSCTDDSAAVAARFPRVRTLEVGHGMVGPTRAAGVEAATAASPGRPHGLDPSRTWVLSTDADSRVPPDWLLAHLARADQGAHAVVGSVRPTAPTVPTVPTVPVAAEARAVARWHEVHHVGEGHPHVHGANLGVRLDWYRRAGGFSPVAEHEDNRLVDRLEELGATLCRTGAAPVTTSSRLAGRTPGGFAGWLAAAAGPTAAAADAPDRPDDEPDDPTDRMAS